MTPVLAQALHLLLVLAAAPFVPSALAWVEARCIGRAPPRLGETWRELVRLSRKETITPANASPWFGLAPVANLSAVLAVVVLTPSAILGMAVAPLGDLIVIVGLLGAARLIMALASLDGGSALGGIAALRFCRTDLLAEPALLFAVLLFGLAAGTTNLDLIAGLQQERVLRPVVALVLAAGAVGILGLSELEPRPADDLFGGVDLALLRASEAFRLIAWLDLIGVLFLPFGMAVAHAPSGWPLGILVWLLRSGALLLLLAAVRLALGRLAPVLPRLLLMSAALTALAVLLVLARVGPV
jgi:formate hydrogenlyase subunit 4